MVAAGWYVLYRDGAFHRVRATDDLDRAIATAGELHRAGRDVIQLGPLDSRSECEALGASEIRRLCARLAESWSPNSGDRHPGNAEDAATPMRTRRL